MLPVLRLRVIGGPEDGRVLSLSVGEIIGRPEYTPHGLDDDTVSRQHAQIGWDQGNWTIVDLGSTSGTLRNHEPVLQARLNHGDVLTLGQTMLVVEEPSTLFAGGADNP